MSKDWTGNKKSTFSTLGASNHSEHDRETHDYYATEPSAIDDLLSVETFQDSIWEPACGEGHLAKRMSELGKFVLATDLIDRGFGKGGIDFLSLNLPRDMDIVTNPPYKYAQEFIEKAITLSSGKVAMFLKLTFLEGQQRQKFFLRTPPARIWIYAHRKKCALNGDFENTGSSAACYAWFIWEKNFKGSPTIGWITPHTREDMLLR